MTQYEAARKSIITAEMRRVAVRENVTPEFIRDEVALGRLVIPANIRHLAGSGGGEPEIIFPPHPNLPPPGGKGQEEAPSNPKPLPQGGKGLTGFHGMEYPGEPVGHPTAKNDAMLWVNQTVAQRTSELADDTFMNGQKAPKRLDPMGIGRMVTTKVNANIGASPVSSSTDEEVDKLKWAQRFGADTLMDLSTGGNLDECRQALIDNSTIAIGTVPIYSMIIGRKIEDLSYDDILKTIEHQARQGVDYFTVHAGLLRRNLHLIEKRKTGLVSRGGSILAKWMIHNNKENPTYTLFDEISAIMREYDVTYSLGDGVRPGCIADAGDSAQIAELEVLGELVQRAREAGVQVMVEGPGHVPLHEVAWNMQVEQRICDDAPFYVLGPLVTDVFPGYDHITSCIGATEAARAGAAMLCYVTPKEHVGLPKTQDVKEGCVAYKIAAHAGDIARGIAGAKRWDEDMSGARAALNWPRQFELAFDGETARAYHDEDLDVDTDFCAMCGHDWCSMRISKEITSFISGKDADAQPEAKVTKSPGLSTEAKEILERRRQKEKLACHSDIIDDDDKAIEVQKDLVKK
jgi:phosphomethylpyrimidine synthase